MPEIPATTPIKRAAAVPPAASASAVPPAASASVAPDASAREAEASDDSSGKGTPTLVDAEEALRLYRQNILLVGEALLTLELMERGALDESEQRIATLTQSCPDKESALLIRTLLSHWLSRARTIAGRPADEPTPAPQIAARPQTPEGDHKTVPALKREGLDFYSRGDLGGAVSCWRRILELDPADTETRQFLQRAEAILRNRRAG